jgi:hypothetical protein
MAKESFIQTPFPIDAPDSMKGGPGKYDGANNQGLPTRTSSPNAVPEKFYDQQPPLTGGDD